jgi:hypothetical protein
MNALQERNCEAVVTKVHTLKTPCVLYLVKMRGGGGVTQDHSQMAMTSNEANLRHLNQ